MNLRLVFSLSLAGVVGLAGPLTAQRRNDDRIQTRVRPADRAEVIRTRNVVVSQSNASDPCYDSGRSRRDSHRFCEVREQTMPAGPLVVDAGRNGGIQVEGWDNNQIRVLAIVNTQAATADQAKQLASGVQVQAAGGRISSEGPSTDGREGWSVSFRINVPRQNDLDLKANNGGVSITGVNGNIRFDTSNGGVRLSDLGGDVRGETHNGGVNVRLSGERWDGTGLDVETTNGGVVLAVPEGYNAELTTRTVNGGFRTEYPMTLQGELSPRRGISTTLGSGGAPVNVRTTNGGLRIERR